MHSNCLDWLSGCLEHHSWTSQTLRGDGHSFRRSKSEDIQPGLYIEVAIGGEARTLSVDNMWRFGGRMQIEGTNEYGNSGIIDMDDD